ncbi:hypothetical protein [Kitasatospora cineracea]|uniref:hypothetical protein n=1 Tax=Kitasatospora cineracea TaxID=88074 RepID=UPI000F4F6D85|nr:hypothetical protein [Kitasatospora cineracea]
MALFTRTGSREQSHTWNNSTTSIFGFTHVNTRVVNGTTVVELTGSITSGTFQGATVSSTAVAANTPHSTPAPPPASEQTSRSPTRLRPSEVIDTLRTRNLVAEATRPR